MRVGLIRENMREREIVEEHDILEYICEMKHCSVVCGQAGASVTQCHPTHPAFQDIMSTSHCHCLSHVHTQAD